MEDDFSYYSKNESALLNGIASFSEEDQDKIRDTLTFIKNYHAGQKRDETETENVGYIIHPVRAARWLIDQGAINADIIIATLLHDSLEDTSITEEVIEKNYGRAVLKLVVAVTRPRPSDETEIEKTYSKQKKLETILKAPEDVRLIKTADMLDNMRSWKFISHDNLVRKKFPRWFNEAKHYYIPIAQSINTDAAREMKTILERNMTST